MPKFHNYIPNNCTPTTFQKIVATVRNCKHCGMITSLNSSRHHGFSLSIHVFFFSFYGNSDMHMCACRWCYSNKFPNHPLFDNKGKLYDRFSTIDSPAQSKCGCIFILAYCFSVSVLLAEFWIVFKDQWFNCQQNSLKYFTWGPTMNILRRTCHS